MPSVLGTVTTTSNSVWGPYTIWTQSTLCWAPWQLREEIMFHQVAYRTREPWAHLDEQREARGRTCAHTQSPASNMWESYITALSYSFHLPNLALVGESDVHPCLCIDLSALGLPLWLLLSGIKEDSGLTCDLFLQVHWPLSLESRSHFLLRDLPLPFSSWQRNRLSLPVFRNYSLLMVQEVRLCFWYKLQKALGILWWDQPKWRVRREWEGSTVWSHIRSHHRLL